MLKAPQNLFATAYDGSVRSDWQTVDGADGYILQFYNHRYSCPARVQNLLLFCDTETDSAGKEQTAESMLYG